MKVEPATQFSNVASLGRERVGGLAGNAFSTSLQNATSARSSTQQFAPLLRLAPSQSPLAASKPAKAEQSLNERALGLRAYRQELLASNIANADTPNYKAVDIDINEALRTGKTKDDVQVQYRVPAQGSADGNTVDMDIERSQFSQNALMYEYTVDRVRGHYKEMEELLKNLPY